MKPGFVVLIVAGAVTTLAGTALLVAALVRGSKANEPVTHEYALEGEVKDFDFKTSTADVNFIVSTNDTKKVVVNEYSKSTHEVTLNEGKLTITSNEDERKWYDFFFYNNKNMEINVYLPAGNYNDFKLDASTGDLLIPTEYHFENVDSKLSTGDCSFACSVTNEFKAHVSTGNITLDGIEAKNIILDSSTGNISLKNCNVQEDVNIESSTGHKILDGLKARNLVLKASTGKLTLNNIEAASLTSNSSSGDVLMDNAVFSGDMNITTSTGDVTITGSDAAKVNINTSTGEVNANFLSPKIVFADTNTGHAHYPHSTSGGECNITTSTGDIDVTF